MLGVLPLAAGPDALAPAALRCEYLTDPLGIDVEPPRLSWQLPSGARAQSAYQILVASSAGNLRPPRRRCGSPRGAAF
jgi:alpha-L-rhamnosidase